MSEQPVTRRVVVGFDGSAHSQAALRWAAMEAVARAGELLVVTACRDDLSGKQAWQRTFIDGLPEPPQQLSQLVVRESPAQSLISIAGSDLLVVGAASRGRVGSFVLGSVAFSCSEHAAGPVVVVRSAMAFDSASAVKRPVIAAMDDSAGAKQALRFAGEESRIHGWPLTAVHVLYRDYLMEQATDHPTPRDAALLGPDESAWVQLKRAVETHLPADLTAAPIVLIGDPVDALTVRSAAAALVAVGRSGGSHRMDAMLGSVRMGLLQRSACPVAVVPASAYGP